MNTRRLLWALTALCVGAVVLYGGCRWRANSFFQAVRTGDALRVQRMLAFQPNYLVNAKDTFGSTPLNRAVEHDQPEIVEILLAAGSDIHHESPRLGIPLNYAALWGFTETAVVLLDGGADMEREATTKSYNQSGAALFNAAGGGRLQIVEELIARGALVNSQITTESRAGVTPLLAAVGPMPFSPDRLEVVIALLDAGARMDLANNDGVTPLLRVEKVLQNYQDVENVMEQFRLIRSELKQREADP